MLARWLWLAGSIAALAVIVATSTDWVQAADRANRLAAPLLVGFAAQVLIGALSYLIPVVLGGGPSVVRATTGMLDKRWAARVTIVNLGQLTWSVVPADRARVPSALLVIGVLALFLPLSLRSVLIARRSAAQSRGAGEPGGVG